ncbi:hypothetical protein ACOQFV_27390 [Nocardiopsis changdeensis]|uniref:MarR family transcriptional regulator n=1 Tax=Nocardiopsis changdeensis TaxID=2831969 RepID=A0ABX8BQJ7_9ACTN|nr:MULTISPECIES: hypothetical protein [Nocardiopsis]QUX22993.1 hypothetical protein KGD84_00850 [Nocardiopsis changdeensis]QYX38936.1 hypothetical protein K1J57_10300 [Nocardiopsis sp. MT53]
MVTQPPAPEGLTVTEIAAKYGRSRGVVNNTWVLSEEWKASVRRLTPPGVKPVRYDAQDVDALVRTWMWFPPETTDIPADRPLTMKQVAAYTGLDYSVVRTDASRGVLKGHAQDDADGRPTWTRAQVDRLYTGRRIRARKPKK